MNAMKTMAIGFGRWAGVAWVALVLALGTGRARGQARPEPPSLVTFIGSLAAPDGSPIGGAGAVIYPMVFHVFDNDMGGTLLWSEQQLVSVEKGEFSVLLGQGNAFANEPRPLLLSVFQGPTASDRFVEVTVRASGGGTDATVTPRTRLMPGPFGLVAGRALTAQTMVNKAGKELLVTAGNRVGVNQANPQANLDVGTGLMTRGLDVREDLTMGEGVEARGFNGLGMAPVGTILMWNGSTPPRGWVLCDGSEVAGVKTPDLRGRFVLGQGRVDGFTARNSGEQGGRETIAFSQDQMPSHSHGITFSRLSLESNSREHSVQIASDGDPPASDGQWYSYTQMRADLGPYNTGFAGDHAHSVSIPGYSSEASGLGRPHSLMPPFYVLAFIMRVQ